jgi:hypothetical protein
MWASGTAWRRSFRCRAMPGRWWVVGGRHVGQRVCVSARIYRLHDHTGAEGAGGGVKMFDESDMVRVDDASALPFPATVRFCVWRVANHYTFDGARGDLRVTAADQYKSTTADLT